MSDMEDLTAALVARRLAGNPWLPIASAPQDGTHILLCVAGFTPCVGLWFQHDYLCPDGQWMPFDPEGSFPNDEALLDYLREGPYEPTDWMPLPATAEIVASEQPPEPPPPHFCGKCGVEGWAVCDRPDCDNIPF